MEVRDATANVEVQDATLIVGVMEGLEPSPGSEEALASVDERSMAVAKFEAKVGQLLTLPHEGSAALMLVGLGSEVSYDTLRAASGNAIRKVKTDRAVSLLAMVDVEGATRAVVEGAVLGGYEFRTYKTDEDEGVDCESVDVVGADPDELVAAVVLAEATILARDWVNTPARDQSPASYASEIADAATEAGVEVEVWDLSRIEEENLGALLGVAAGSDRDPRLVALDYSPEGAETHLALVGKGITFDTGGLSLKTAKFMEEMKDDMAGSAAVVAATIAIARLALPIRITCISPLTDNAVGGDATRPGDVLRPVDGPTIEVTNTDAEGRLILADGLGLARRHDPDLIVDVATLTGASKVALGEKVAAVFASEPELASRVLEAASRAGEHLWEMPLFQDYRKMLDSNVADMKNSTGSRYGGAIAAALFLSEYAGDGPWAHLDIAGPARATETAGEQVKGGSGFGVRTLVELARDLSESE